jgi:hypothetical protein
MTYWSRTGKFIKNFAGLWLSATEKQKDIMKPSARRLIMKYNLETEIKNMTSKWG